jgi:hypothetical protein
VKATGRSGTVLDDRALNRSLLARQLLLERADLSVLGALEHLVGLQAQEPLEPYVGLWSRVRHFEPAELVELLTSRSAVRTLLMRRTLHLVTADDCLALRALHQPMLVKRMRGTLGRRLAGVDLDELAAVAAPHFADQPRRLTDVARTVGDRWPDVAARDLGDALSVLVALVQVPPRGLWGHTAPSARHTTIEAWLGCPPRGPTPDAGELVLRYLRAFGPAATADVRAWSGLTGLPAVIERLRPRLRTFRDQRGRELLDVDGGPLPDPETAAPPRFLPAYDNAVLGYDDRSRIIAVEHRGLSVQGTRFVLVDGRVSGTWTSERADDEASVIVSIESLRRLTEAERDAVGDEGRRLATFLGDGADGRVTVR